MSPDLPNFQFPPSPPEGLAFEYNEDTIIPNGFEFDFDFDSADIDLDTGQELNFNFSATDLSMEHVGFHSEAKSIDKLASTIFSIFLAEDSTGISIFKNNMMMASYTPSAFENRIFQEFQKRLKPEILKQFQAQLLSAVKKYKEENKMNTEKLINPVSLHRVESAKIKEIPQRAPEKTNLKIKVTEKESTKERKKIFRISIENEKIEENKEINQKKADRKSDIKTEIAIKDSNLKNELNKKN